MAYFFRILLFGWNFFCLLIYGRKRCTFYFNLSILCVQNRIRILCVQIGVWTCAFLLPHVCPSSACGSSGYALILYVTAGVWFLQLAIDRYYRWVEAVFLAVKIKIGLYKTQYQEPLCNIILVSKPVEMGRFKYLCNNVVTSVSLLSIRPLYHSKA